MPNSSPQAPSDAPAGASRGRLSQQRGALARAALITGSASLAVLLPFALQLLPVTWARSTYGDAYRLFEFFGLSGLLLVACLVALDARAVRGRSAADLAPTLLFAAVALHWLFIVSEYSWKAADFESYLVGARAVLAGRSPYPGPYIYPPLLAHALGLALRAVLWVAARLGPELAVEEGWAVVFYLYQCGQYLAILAAYRLTATFAARLGFSPLVSSLLTAALFLVNNPLLRTVRHDQVNVFVLLTVLGSILILDTRPAAAGALVALGGHLKLLPFALALPLVLTRRWRALAGAAVASVGIVAAELAAGVPWSVFAGFLDYLSDPKRGLALRDNSIHSLIANVISVVSGVGPGETLEAAAARLKLAAAPYAFAATAAVLLWFAVRVWRYLRAARPQPAGMTMEHPLATALAMEMIGLMLVASPVVWEHHFVLAIPLALWVAALRGRDRPVAVLVAAGLVFWVPTFDLFPLSYHRLAGLVTMLLLVTPPSRSATMR